MSVVYAVASPPLGKSGYTAVCVQGPDVGGAVLLDGDLKVCTSTLVGGSSRMILEGIHQFYVKGTSYKDAYHAFLLWLSGRTTAIKTLPHNEKVWMVNAVLREHAKTNDGHKFLVMQCAVKVAMSNLGCVVIVTERTNIYVCVLSTRAVRKMTGPPTCTEHASDNAMQVSLETWCCLKSGTIAETREQRQDIFDSFARFIRGAGFDVRAMPSDTWTSVQCTLLEHQITYA